MAGVARKASSPHKRFHQFAGQPPRLAVRVGQRVKRVHLLGGQAGERLLNDLRDLEEPQPPAQERVHGDLVGGVERARRGPPGDARLPSQAQAGERLGVGRLKRQRPEFGQIERPDRDIDALWVMKPIPRHSKKGRSSMVRAMACSAFTLPSGRTTRPY